MCRRRGLCLCFHSGQMYNIYYRYYNIMDGVLFPPKTYLSIDINYRQIRHNRKCSSIILFFIFILLSSDRCRSVVKVTFYRFWLFLKVNLVKHSHAPCVISFGISLVLDTLGVRVLSLVYVFVIAMNLLFCIINHNISKPFLACCVIFISVCVCTLTTFSVTFVSVRCLISTY